MISIEQMEKIVIDTTCIITALKETLITTPELEKAYLEKFNEMKKKLLDSEFSKDNLL